jgi:integrase
MNDTTSAARKSIPCHTDEDVRNLETRNKPWRNFLGRGLYVFVAPSGTKSFRFNYKALGVGKTHTLGKFGKITLAQAWAMFEQAQSGLEAKVCIRAAQLKTRAQASATLQETFEMWFPLFQKNVGDAYAKRTKRVMISKDLAPLMREKLNALDKPTVLKFCRGLEITRSGSFAREAAHALEKIYEHAISEGPYAGANPAHKITERLTRRDSQHLQALQLEQLPLYFADVEKLASGKFSKPLTIFALKLLPYLTLRQSVLRTAQWKWIDFDACMMTVPAFTEGTKQRATEKRADGRGKAYAAYRVPLARQVIALLRQLHELTGHTGFLFPGYMGRGHTDFHAASDTVWLQALRRMGWNGETEERQAITVHGFRSLFATSAYTRYVITRVDEHALEFQQDHKLTEGVRKNYTRDSKGSHRGLLLPERARLMQWWADEIDVVLRVEDVTKLPQSRVEMVTAFASIQQTRQSPQLSN